MKFWITGRPCHPHKKVYVQVTSCSSCSLITTIPDYNTLLKLQPTDKESKEIQDALQRIKPHLETAQKRETAEMLDKLKTLGNSFLGMDIFSSHA